MKKIFYFLVIILTVTINSNAQCWQKIAPGGSHTLAIKNDGTLWAWGNNFHGALGDGSFTNRSTPVQVGTGANWSVISANEEVDGTPKNNFSLAIKTDGTLWAWGNNNSGQLGILSTGNYNTPVQVGIDNNWLSVSAGRSFSLGIKTDGTLWAWGFNQNGELGLGDFAPRSTPVQIGTATNWANISAGYEASAALTTTGTIWTWGVNSFGQLGDATNTNRNTPAQVGTSNDWQMVSNSGLHMMAIKSAGTLWAWGLNNFGQLGNGTITNSNLPMQIGTDTDWDTTVSGYLMSMALKTNGTRWAWGNNSYGEYGIGTLDGYTEPFQTGTETDWQTISVKSYTAFGVRTGSNLLASGLNDNGQIGDGTTIDKLNPVQVSCNITLPVTWLSVNGQLQNGNAIIKWATASESNTDKFEIEHSTDGINYNKVETTAAAGNSSSTKQYEFIHPSPASGRNYYRIKQIDIDGRFTYSSIIVLQNSDAKAKVIIAPNPVINTVSLFFSESGNKTIQLISMDGRILLTQNNNGANSTHLINMEQMPAGMYILRLVTGKGTETYKINKQ